MTGYVAVHAAPERDTTTRALWDELQNALTALTKASREVNRLIGELP